MFIIDFFELYVVTDVLWKCNVTFGLVSNIDCKSIWHKSFLCIEEEMIISILFFTTY